MRMVRAMPFYADLHVHSKFSRATSKQCDLEHLAFWAARKGVSVLATGDFTYPEWFDEIREKLVPAEPGLFRLRKEIAADVEKDLPGASAGETRFLLQVEISTIYKRGDRCRKVHHLLYAPDMESADRIRQELDKRGNIRSDGRPILGLDSRELLDITLSAGEGTFLVPAHIWTPWFSVLGSKSGFDSIEACYGELASEIFALETGLSSDPPMNWRVSGLDRFRLISNSDLHSPSKIGREACVFDTDRDYFAMREALRTGKGYEGTVEFFPEEGKYHADGHRKCETRLTPEETAKHKGLCPVCGKPVTVGVSYRVAELADKQLGRKPKGAAPFRSLIPLTEVLSELRGTGPATKGVLALYESLLQRLGPELMILQELPLDRIEKEASLVLAEAIGRMRSGKVIRQAGYDGEYGVIRLFTPEELTERDDVGKAFRLACEVPPPSKKKAGRKKTRKKTARKGGKGAGPKVSPKPSARLLADPPPPPTGPQGQLF